MKKNLIWSLLIPSGTQAPQFSQMGAQVCTAGSLHYIEMSWKRHTYISVYKTYTFQTQSRYALFISPCSRPTPGDLYALPLTQTSPILAEDAEDAEVHLHFCEQA